MKQMADDQVQLFLQDISLIHIWFFSAESSAAFDQTTDSVRSDLTLTEDQDVCGANSDRGGKEGGREDETEDEATDEDAGEEEEGDGKEEHEDDENQAEAERMEVQDDEGKEKSETDDQMSWFSYEIPANPQSTPQTGNRIILNGRSVRKFQYFAWISRAL